jgi:HAD superfamily hydrolase (TIGR01509 family)
MKYNYFLFDLDGVLSNTDKIQYNCTRNAILEQTQFDITTNETLNNIFLSTITTQIKLQKLYEENIITKEEINIIYEKKKQLADIVFSKLQKDPVKIELFQYLKNNGKKIAVVTNGNKESARLILQNIGVFPFIDILITNNDVINKKPHSEPYIRAMLHFSGKIEEYIIFEDSETGLQAARGTGADVIHVKNVEEINKENIIKILTNNTNTTHSSFQ